MVPKDQLLIFDLSDGWEPLCKFLGKPIPNKEFPHRNKQGSITDEIVENSYIFDPIKTEFVIVLSVVFALLCFAIYYFLF